MSVTEAAGTAAKLPLTFACGLYDRMLRLYTGEVQPRGIDSRRSWCRAGARATLSARSWPRAKSMP